MIMPGGSPSIKTAGLSSIFQAKENIYIVAETMEEYSLPSSEAAYENIGVKHQWYSWHQIYKFRDNKIHPSVWNGNVHISPP